MDLARITAALRASWDDATCDPVDRPWSPANPAKGQCGVTALVLNDLVGGDLVVAEVLHADGTRQGDHTWNRLPDGTEVDLTLEQFQAGEVVQPGRVVARPDGPPRRCVEEYELLRRRVVESLG